MTREQKAKILRLRRHFMRVDWAMLVFAIEEDIPGFRVRYKDESLLQRLIGVLSLWNRYDKFTTTIYPEVWFESRTQVARDLPTSTLEHEWVHLKDAKTFFGWLPNLPPWLNANLFTLAYLFPQVLVLLALLGFAHPAFFLFLVFALPLPAPFRAYAEARAYRRSIELGGYVGDYLKSFTGASYYWMMPSEKTAQKWLSGPSPYVKEMDPKLRSLLQ